MLLLWQVPRRRTPIVVAGHSADLFLVSRSASPSFRKGGGEMKQAYEAPANIRPDTIKLLTDVQRVIDDFQDEPFTLSVRQIY